LIYTFFPIPPLPPLSPPPSGAPQVLFSLSTIFSPARKVECQITLSHPALSTSCFLLAPAPSSTIFSPDSLFFPFSDILPPPIGSFLSCRTRFSGGKNVRSRKTSSSRFLCGFLMKISLRSFFFRHTGRVLFSRFPSVFDKLGFCRAYSPLRLLDPPYFFKLCQNPSRDARNNRPSWRGTDRHAGPPSFPLLSPQISFLFSPSSVFLIPSLNLDQVTLCGYYLASPPG